MKKQRVILENFWSFFEPNTHIRWEKQLIKEGCGKLSGVNGDNQPINPLYTHTDVISSGLRKKFSAFPQTWSKIGKNTTSLEALNLGIIQFYFDAGFSNLWLESTTSVSYPQSTMFLKECGAYHHGLVIELNTFLNTKETVDDFFSVVPNILFTYTLPSYQQHNSTTQVLFIVEQLIHRHKKTTTGFTLNIKESPELKSHSCASTLATLLYEVYTYIDFFTENNLQAEDLFSHINFIISPEEDYFLSISKHLALRMLWEDFYACYGLKTASPAVIYTEPESIPKNSDAEQHEYLLRLTMHAMSSIQGGSNGMFLPPAHLLEGKADQRLSVNLAHLLETESLLTQQRNAAEGTYYIESLTHSLYKEAKEELFKRITQ